jgi:hypothetical protein
MNDKLLWYVYIPCVQNDFGEELLTLLPKPKLEDGIFWFLIQITNCTQNICTFFVEFVNPVLIVPCIKYALQSCQHLKHKDFQFPVIAR